MQTWPVNVVLLISWGQNLVYRDSRTPYQIFRDRVDKTSILMKIPDNHYLGQVLVPYRDLKLKSLWKWSGFARLMLIRLDWRRVLTTGRLIIRELESRYSFIQLGSPERLLPDLKEHHLWEVLIPDQDQGKLSPQHFKSRQTHQSGLLGISMVCLKDSIPNKHKTKEESHHTASKTRETGLQFHR